MLTRAFGTSIPSVTEIEYLFTKMVAIAEDPLSISLKERTYIDLYKEGFEESAARFARTYASSLHGLLERVIQGGDAEGLLSGLEGVLDSYGPARALLFAKSTKDPDTLDIVRQLCASLRLSSGHQDDEDSE